MAVALYLLVEGDTEERFANQVLVPHFAPRGVCAHVSKVITRGRRGRPEAQGGGRTYRAWKKDLTIWIRQQAHRHDVWFSTMLDLYGLAGLSDGFPDYEQQRDCRDPYEKVRKLEHAWAEDIAFHRFIPYLQLHEFEALVLTDVAVLRHQFIEHPGEVDSLAAEIAACGKLPEEIDEGPDSAPSKRIIRCLPQYKFRKAEAGAAAARTIGLARLREACPHFGAWLARLEQLGQA